MIPEYVPIRRILFPQPQCPVHGDTMKFRVNEVRAGLRNRLVMVYGMIWTCWVKKCPEKADDL